MSRDIRRGQAVEHSYVTPVEIEEGVFVSYHGILC